MSIHIRSERRQLFGGMKLHDPLPEMIEDTKEISTIFERYGIIPFAGTTKATGDRLRQLLKLTSRFSTTHKGCIKAKCDMGFSGYLSLWRSGLFDKGAEVETTLAAQYAEAFKSINYFGALDYMAWLSEVGKELLAFGNTFIEVYMYSVGGEQKMQYRKLPFDSSYLIYDDKKSKLYYLSAPKLNTLSEENEVTPLFPDFKEHELGYKSVLHIKNGLGIYGESDALDSIQNQYSEYQNMAYLLSLADSNYTMRVIMEFEGSNPETSTGVIDSEDGYEGERNTDTVFDKFTTEGGADQLFITERPYGSKPMYVHELKGHTDISYYTGLADLNAEAIIRSHRWSHRLLGDNVSAGMNSEVYRQEWISKYDTVVTAFVQSILRPLDRVNDVFWKYAGKDELTGINQFIKNPLEDVFRGMGDSTI